MLNHTDEAAACPKPENSNIKTGTVGHKKGSLSKHNELIYPILYRLITMGGPEKEWQFLALETLV